MNINWHEVPGFTAALEQETTARESSFFLEREWIAGVEVLPLNSRHLATLSQVGCPFAHGRQSVSSSDVARFLWVISPRFSFCPRERDRFVRNLKRLDAPYAVECISRYLDESFQDSPSSGGESVKAAPASWPATIVHVLAINYGWLERDIMEMPLKRAFQYLRLIRLHHDPDAVMINPSDRVKGQYLRDLNAKN